MALLYDLVVVLVLLVFFVFGAKKGFVKSILSLICFIVALVVSLFASSKLAEPIYEMCFKERVTAFIEENISKVDVSDIVNSYLLKNVGITADEKTVKSIIGTDGDIKSNIEAYAKAKGVDLDMQSVSDNVESFLSSDSLKNAIESALPSSLASAVFSAAQSSSETVAKVLQACVNPDDAKAADAIEEAFVNELIILLLKYVIFLLMFLVLSFVLKLIIAATGILNKIPVAGGVNRALGGALGIIKGSAALIIIAIIVSALSALLSSQYSALSESTIENSLVFKYFYDLVK